MKLLKFLLDRFSWWCPNCYYECDEANVPVDKRCPRCLYPMQPGGYG